MNLVGKHTVAIVDDHSLFARSLEKLINSFSNFRVVFHAKNGNEFKDIIAGGNNLPDIVLLDINMPVMNGFETAEWIMENHPKIKILALSM